MLSGFCGSRDVSMAINQRIFNWHLNKAPTSDSPTESGTQNALTAIPHDAMRCDRMRCDAISIRFVYRKTNTWLFNISAKCVCVCVYVLAAVRYSWLAKWVVTFQNANVSSSWKQYACAVGSAPSSPTKSRLYPLARTTVPPYVCRPKRRTYVNVMKFLPQIALNSSLKRAKSEWY